RLRQSNQLLKNKIEENRQINFRLSIANNQLMDLALLDELTGIPNRRIFRRFIDRSFDCVTQGVLFSVIMVDIDLFKQFNDHYGHEEGDKILVAVAKLLNSIVENPDEIVVRWGGEEFVYASFHKTQEDITAIAVLIKEKLRDLHLQHEESPNHYVTASLGTSTIPAQSKKDVSKAVALADRAMYMAKSSGRNCLKSLNDVSELRPDFALAVREGNRN
ncbi:MAG: GGDEF domain-containing protein, partial [Clostridiales bacterium]|nr:GGDEF domain-containing protein [Clostridiales bacterium]